jgi:hypothetical protein
VGLVPDADAAQRVGALDRRDLCLDRLDERLEARPRGELRVAARLPVEPLAERMAARLDGAERGRVGDERERFARPLGRRGRGGCLRRRRRRAGHGRAAGAEGGRLGGRGARGGERGGGEQPAGERRELRAGRAGQSHEAF